MVGVHFSPADSIGARIGTVIAVVTLGISAVGWLWGLAQRTSAPPLPLQRAADELAEQLCRQWDRAIAEQGLTHPALIPVQWRWPLRSVTGPIAEVIGESGGMRCEPLPGMVAVTAEQLRSGTLADLHRVYGGLGSGRMVILGKPGTGKSAAGIVLLRAALAHRAGVTSRDRARVPVPVLVTPQGWDPTVERFAEWLAACLARDYALLQAPEYGRDAAMELIEGGHLAVILDGLAEIPQALRPVALRALDQQATFRLVVLARTGELEEAVRGGRPLRGAAALELLPIDSRQAAQYLASGQIDPPPVPWQLVIDHLRKHPKGTLAQALATPLMLTLIRETYSSGEKVDEFLDDCRFPTRKAVEDHLLDRLLTAAYSQHPAYTEEQARRGLGQLARRMNKDRTRDLAWWRTLWWMSAWPRAFATVAVLVLVSALLVGPIPGLIAYMHLLPAFQAGHLITFAIVFFTWGLGYAFMFGPGFLVSPPGERSSPQRWSRTDIPMVVLLSAGAGIATGLQNLLTATLPNKLVIGLLIGLVSSFVIGLGFALGGGPPQRLGWLQWNRAYTHTDRRTNLHTGLVIGLVAGLVTGLGYGFAYEQLVTGLKYGFLVGIGYLLVIVVGGWASLQGSQLRGSSTPTSTVLLMGIMIAIVSTGGYGIVYVLIVMLGGRPAEPRSELRGSRTPIPTFLSGLVAGPLLWFWHLFTTGDRSELIFDLAVGLGFGLTAGLLLWSRPFTAVTRPLDPQSLWHQERQGGCVAGLVAGLVVGLAYGFGHGLPDGLEYGLVGGLVAGLGSGLVSSGTWAAALASAQLNRRDNTPTPLVQFLEDARRRQILRTVGPVYQFRDARLQKWIANRIPCPVVTEHQVSAAALPSLVPVQSQRG
ncbi:MAG: hypothetical protein JO272_15720 [Pseudonocardiales bacterium]|nr:hypothetical protein [Pseudonocardiales bacterium]